MKSRTEVLLCFYSHFRGRKPSLVDVFARQPRSYWFFMGVLALLVVLCQISGGEAALIVSGMAIGALLRDLGRFLAFRRDWPTLDRFFNWPAVEQELAHLRGPGA